MRTLSPTVFGCIPVRSGTFIISSIHGLVTSFAAGALWVAFALDRNVEVLGWKLNGDKISSPLKVLTGILAGVETLVAVSCAFGVIGTITKNYNMIALYSGFTKSFLVLVVILGVINLVFLWKDDPADACLRSNEPYCANLESFFITGLILVVIPIIVQTAAGYAVTKYAEKLAEDERVQLIVIPYSQSANVEPASDLYSYSESNPGYDLEKNYK
ncbi:hypothetical protein DL96DRAFT_190171 [Flagelloscypha sp. PMI_526]|nr:hypothetical protein DL96DRAFT_190171 [Flagelloscypha sp. PMI_526]